MCSKSPPFRVGDLVTPSSIAKSKSWWKNPAFNYMLTAEFLVTKVVKGITIDENIIHFHDPKYGIRKWRESYLTLVNFSLENE